MANSDRTLRQQIEKARKAQQENEQKCDVQLEIPNVIDKEQHHPEFELKPRKGFPNPDEY